MINFVKNLNQANEIILEEAVSLEDIEKGQVLELTSTTDNDYRPIPAVKPLVETVFAISVNSSKTGEKACYSKVRADDLFEIDTYEEESQFVPGTKYGIISTDHEHDDGTVQKKCTALTASDEGTKVFLVTKIGERNSRKVYGYFSI